MTPAEIIEVIAAGMCHDGEKRDECATCQRKLLAIEAVRRMGTVVEAARTAYYGHRRAGNRPTRHTIALGGALRALDELAESEPAPEPAPERVDLDVPGHFVGAYQCGLTLHTRVGEWRISTVGDYRPQSKEAPHAAPDFIGFNRLYETMVFKLGDNGEPLDWNESAFAGYMTEDEARAGHEAMVARYMGGGS